MSGELSDALDSNDDDTVALSPERLTPLAFMLATISAPYLSIAAFAAFAAFSSAAAFGFFAAADFENFDERSKSLFFSKPSSNASAARFVSSFWLG